MTNAIIVIVGLVVGVVGAVLMVWPTLIVSDKEITRQKMGQVWWLDEKYARKERRFAIGRSVASLRCLALIPRRVGP